MSRGFPTTSGVALDAVRVVLHADVALTLGADASSERLRVLSRAGAAAVHVPDEILAPAGSVLAKVIAGAHPGRLPHLALHSGSTSRRGRRLGPSLVVPVTRPEADDLVLVVARHAPGQSFEETDLEQARRLAWSCFVEADPIPAGESALTAETMVGDPVFQLAFQSAAAGMSIVDDNRRYRWVNAPLCIMLDRSREELLKLTVTDTVDTEYVGRAIAFFERLRRGDFGAVRDRLMFRWPDGRPVWAELGGSVVGTPTGSELYLVQQFDVTAEQNITNDLAYRAMHDDLTGLATRTLLRDRLNAVLARAHRSGTRAVVFYLDVDRFKAINDQHGHTAGDIVLGETARRLSGVVRAADTVARVGGDEFVVAGDATGAAEATQMAERIGNALRPRVNIGGRSLGVSTSIGVALDSPLDGPDDLIARADRALMRAKRLPRPHVMSAEG